MACLDVLDNNNNHGTFFEKMHTGKSYISHMNTWKKNHNNGNLKKEEILKVINRLLYLSAWKAIEVQSPEDNKKEIQNITSTLNPAT